ncbi:MAG: hypothetical protein COA52_09640 [Hyphomicrobiales bacterium]|nr:MAG: hypothetical protein COA52_09640 [Hyphomicrobiales bacterium]
MFKRLTEASTYAGVSSIGFGLVNPLANGSFGEVGLTASEVSRQFSNGNWFLAILFCIAGVLSIVLPERGRR